jgi:predicted GIY-YIG superfamily endonuclease
MKASNPLNKVCCVYEIRSKTEPFKIYIGGTTDYEKRISQHLRLLKSGKHHSLSLQAHYNNYGESDLIFSFLETTDKFNIVEKEEEYLIKNEPYFNTAMPVDNKGHLRVNFKGVLRDYYKRTGEYISLSDLAREMTSEGLFISFESAKMIIHRHLSGKAGRIKYDLLEFLKRRFDIIDMNQIIEQ